MADVKKIQGYVIKDEEARNNISDLDTTLKTLKINFDNTRGYGYGESIINIGSTTDDSAFLVELSNQFNLIPNKTKQISFIYSGFSFIGTLWNAGNNYGSLIAYSYSDTTTGVLLTKLSRICINGVWQEWEWENPPLYSNDEYRTNERYLGKPVYIKLLNYGTLAVADTTITINLGIQGDETYIANVVDFEIMIKRASGNVYKFPMLSLYDAQGVLTGYFNQPDKSIVVQTNEDLSDATAMVLIKYTRD